MASTTSMAGTTSMENTTSMANTPAAAVAQGQLSGEDHAVSVRDVIYDEKDIYERRSPE